MHFKSKYGSFPLPLFFPDATRGTIKTLDSSDIVSSNTPGILVNTYHLLAKPGKKLISDFGGVAPFINWKGPIISDSGGFQVMSIAKRTNCKVNDKGVYFKAKEGRQTLLTPEKSIDFQFALKTDLLVVLDDFTPPNASRSEAKKTVDRTILWAKRSKIEFDRLIRYHNIKKGNKPYLIGVVQGGKYQDLRKKCGQELVKIGFDGVGFGGWPIDDKNEFDYQTASTIAKVAPKNYLLYGLGIGKPHEIVKLVKMGYSLFDCVLPTRDARHGRLYIYNADSTHKINLNKKNFYSYLIPHRQVYKDDPRPVSTACDCLLCKNYTRAYLHHLFKESKLSAMRLATIHNLRFYSILMEKLRK